MKSHLGWCCRKCDSTLTRQGFESICSECYNRTFWLWELILQTIEQIMANFKNWHWEKWVKKQLKQNPNQTGEDLLIKYLKIK